MSSRQLGKYTILDSLGAGATAEVFRAQDTSLGREVALKVLKPALVTDAAAFARFAQEAQAAAQLFHPPIALVLDMDSAESRYFIAMQYIAGLSLDRILAERGPLPWPDVLRLAEDVGGALAFAHARGFLHRDVKPSNILCTSEGEYVLTDFGLTRAMMATGLTSHTGAVLGTPAYIAPEIWLGQKATPATDEYALACVLVEASTGEVLFAGDTPPAVMTRHVLSGAELPQTWPDGVPVGVNGILRQALAKEPTARHGGPGFLAVALGATMRDTAPVLPATATEWPVPTTIDEPSLDPGFVVSEDVAKIPVGRTETLEPELGTGEVSSSEADGEPVQTEAESLSRTCTVLVVSASLCLLLSAFLARPVAVEGAAFLASLGLLVTGIVLAVRAASKLAELDELRTKARDNR